MVNNRPTVSVVMHLLFRIHCFCRDCVRMFSQPFMLDCENAQRGIAVLPILAVCIRNETFSTFMCWKSYFFERNGDYDNGFCAGLVS